VDQGGEDKKCSGEYFPGGGPHDPCGRKKKGEVGQKGVGVKSKKNSYKGKKRVKQVKS